VEGSCRRLFCSAIPDFLNRVHRGGLSRVLFHLQMLSFTKVFQFGIGFTYSPNRKDFSSVVDFSVCQAFLPNVKGSIFQIHF
jgi:hypothetical protein